MAQNRGLVTVGSLEGQVALITGGGSGLGAAVVDRFLAEGAEVAVLELMSHKVEHLREYYGDRVLALQGDVTRVDDLIACRHAIFERFGRLSALVGTQGVWDGNVRLRDFDLSDLDQAFDELFHVNVKGFVLSARVFADMLSSSRGSITFTLSNASFDVDGGGILYTATKHAGVGIVRQLAFELAPDVRVNAVAPCAIKGSDLRGPRSLGLHGHSQADRPEDLYADYLAQLLPLRTYPAAEEYTGIYALLASPRDSGVMTGEIVVADQGLAVRGLGME